MSLIPPGSAPYYDISLYASVQAAVTTAALYDHALAFGREVDLIWMKPPSLVTALYIVERYLGDVVLIWPVLVFFGIWVRRGIKLFQFRAWGALVYSWATQATMQLRIYAMYRRSRAILLLLLTLFLCEITAIALIIWQEIGPGSTLQALDNVVFGEHFCTFSGIDSDFVYIFIPFLCFEFFLFLLAAHVFVDNMKRNRKNSEQKGLGLNSFMCVLARDSLCYFFVNLIACAVVMSLWQSVTEIYANICVPLVMLLEVLVGTKLILNFRERYARFDPEPVVSGRCSPLHFRGDEIQMETARVSVRCQVDTIVVTDAERRDSVCLSVA